VCIVVSDGCHVYRVKKVLEFRGLTLYGSPRPASGAYTLCSRIGPTCGRPWGLVFNVGIFDLTEGQRSATTSMALIMA
jgi:hypothetical protein